MGLTQAAAAETWAVSHAAWRARAWEGGRYWPVFWPLLFRACCFLEASTTRLAGNHEDETRQ